MPEATTSELIRFWFPVPGHLGIGVTAPSLAEATELATEVALELGWAFDPREVEQNVDPAHLDPHRVLPEILTTVERESGFHPEGSELTRAGGAVCVTNA